MKQVVEGVDTSSPSWVWEDPYGDCAYEAGAVLVIRAANGRELAGTNLSAPCLLRHLPNPGSDVVVQVAVAPALGDRPGIGGLVLWKDKINYLLLELGRIGQREVLLGAWVDGQFDLVGRVRMPGGGQGKSPPAWPILLRLELDGENAKALCSLNGHQWFSVGHTTFVRDDVTHVGVFAIGTIDRTIYRGAYPEGTAIRFTSFRLWA